MTRRSFRVGLLLGLLAGSGVAVVVTARKRAATPPTPVRAPVAPPAGEPARTPGPAAAPGTEPVTAAVEPVVEPVAQPAVEPLTEPAAERGAPDTAWIDPLDGGSCPGTHPVKAKLTSGIFHLPGMAMYARTRADRCYVSAEAAEADGLRRSTR